MSQETIIVRVRRWWASMNKEDPEHPEPFLSLERNIARLFGGCFVASMLFALAGPFLPSGFPINAQGWSGGLMGCAFGSLFSWMIVIRAGRMKLEEVS